MEFDSAIHRAAVLIKSLPQQQANRLLSQLDAKDLQTVVKKLRTVGPVSNQLRLLAIQKFLDETQQITAKTANSINAKSFRRKAGPFDFLIEVSDSTRSRILIGEHPKVLAVVLSFLPTKTASQTLNEFEPERRVAILRRLCQTESFDPREVSNISIQLQARWQRLVQSDLYREGGIGVASKLLSCTDIDTQRALIASLDQQDPELASELKHQVLCFDDLRYFNDKDVKVILKWVDTSLWAPALKNADQEVRQKVFNNMGPRPRKLLNQEIQDIGVVNANAIADAQGNVMRSCLLLAEKNRITLPVVRSSAEQAA